MTVRTSVLWKIKTHMAKKWPEKVVQRSYKGTFVFKTVFDIYLVLLFGFQVINGFSSIFISCKSRMFCSSEVCKGNSLGVLNLFRRLKYVIPKHIIRNNTAIIKNDIVTVDPEEAFFALVLIFLVDWTAAVFSVVETKVTSISFGVVILEVNVVSSFFEFLKIWWILTCWF